MIKTLKTSYLGPWLMKSSQSNSNLRSPGSYLAHSYLIATVQNSLIILPDNEGGTVEGTDEGSIEPS